MKAVLLTEIGTSGNLIYKSIDAPLPVKDEVLIKVKYCGLNHLDLLIKQGKRPGPKSFPHILGSEIVGEIKLVNSKNTAVKIGDIVAVYPWTFCGKCQECLKGHENICDQGGTLGRTCWGGYAEYVTTPIQNLVKIPKSLSLDAVCASLLTATTAYHLLDRAQIKKGSTVLVTGATGGVGTFVIQLLKNKKCTVLAVTSHKEKIKLLQALGVSEIVLTDRFKEHLRKKYPGGIDYVIDIMGGTVWSDSIDMLAKNGTLVFCSTTLDGLGTVNIGNAFSRQINILGSYGGSLQDLKEALILLKKGAVKPVIDAVFPLLKANEALEKLAGQKAFGKIILKV